MPILHIAYRVSPGLELSTYPWGWLDVLPLCCGRGMQCCGVIKSLSKSRSDGVACEIATVVNGIITMKIGVNMVGFPSCLPGLQTPTLKEFRKGVAPDADPLRRQLKAASLLEGCLEDG